MPSLLLDTLLVQGAGPRVPLGSSSRGHADPQWISQRHSDKDMGDLPDFSDAKLDDWEVSVFLFFLLLSAHFVCQDFDEADPEPWTEMPSHYDTTELEEEMEFRAGGGTAAPRRAQRQQQQQQQEQQQQEGKREQRPKQPTQQSRPPVAKDKSSDVSERKMNQKRVLISLKTSTTRRCL